MSSLHLSSDVPPKEKAVLGLGLGRASCIGKRELSKKRSATKIFVRKDIAMESQRLQTCSSHELQKLNHLLEAVTLEEQAMIIKKIITDVNNEGKSSLGPSHLFQLRFMSDLFFEVELKDPLKSLLSSALCGVKTDLQPVLTKTLQDLLRERINISLLDLRLLQKGTVDIFACFEYFSSAEVIIDNCLFECLSCLHKAITCFNAEYRTNTSPTERNQQLQACHMAIRTAIILLQRCKKALQINQSHREQTLLLQSMRDSLTVLLKDSQVPMDMKSNCGLAVVVLIWLLDSSCFWPTFSRCVEQEINDKQLTGKDFWEGIKHVEPFMQLSICTGLMSGLPGEELVTLQNNTTSVLEKIFWQLRNISRNLVDSILVLGCSRAMLLWCNKVLDQSQRKNLFCDDSVVTECTECIWSWLEHYMESVRHTGRKVLEALIDILVQFKANGTGEAFKFIDMLVDNVLQMSTYRKPKYITMSCLSDAFGAERFLQLRPSIPQDLLDAIEDPTMASHVAEAYQRLMLQHRKEFGERPEWQKTWMEPLLQKMATSRGLERNMEGVVVQVLKQVPSITHYVLSSWCEDGHGSVSQDKLQVIITCLKLARKHGFVKEDHSCSLDTWKGIVKKSLMVQALLNHDDEVRGAAFAVIVDSQKSTELFTAVDLDLMRTCLPYSLNGQNPAFRQLILSIIKRMLTRLKESVMAHLKRMQQKRNQSEAILSEKTVVEHYHQFLLWFCELQFSSLFPGANFSRRGFALEILTLVNSLYGLSSREPLDLFPLMTVENGQILLESLMDSYDSYKILALILLKEFDMSLLGMQDVVRVKSLVEAAFQLASNARPHESVIAAFLLRLLVCAPAINDVLSEILPSHNMNQLPEEKYYSMLQILYARLQKELDIARQSIIEAAAEGPMYGLLLCIRVIIGDINLKLVASNPLWRKLIGDLVSLCYDLTAVVTPVVSSSSPEGHLPMDFDYDVAALVQKVLCHAIGNKADTQNCKSISELQSLSADETAKVRCVTAQMLLLCSWRTMKEVCLFLGEVCYSMPIADVQVNSRSDGEEYLLTVQQVLRIGEHFMNLTAETKHRGAFEQAYIGFSKVCSMLWRSKLKFLHKLPQVWLEDLLKSIQGQGSKSTLVCTTRRSAGIPYMIQALVSTELGVQGVESLHLTVNSLLQLCTSQMESNVEPRVHAMNILRALFRDARLGEPLAPYVAQGIQEAILGFKGQTWAERNSATLLYSALMTRIFGVKRTKDELSKKNCMTGRLFFQRYPTLYDFLMCELQCAVQSEQQMSPLQTQSSLYPVLMLLARLYPSSSEALEGSPELATYIPLVQWCGESAILNTRVLAAKALVPLVLPENRLTMVNNLFEQLGAKKASRGHNWIHGILLQIFHLLQEMETDAVETASSHLNSMRNDGTLEISGWLSVSEWLLKSNPCLVTCETYVSVLDEIICNPILVLPQHKLGELLMLLTKRLQLKINHFEVGSKLCCQAMAKLTLTIITAEDSLHSKLPNVLKLLLNHQHYEVRLVALHFLLEVLKADGSGEESGVPQPHGSFKNGSSCSVQEMSGVISALVQMATGDEKHPECVEKVFKVLTLIPEEMVQEFENVWSLPHTLSFMVSFCQSAVCEEIAAAVIVSSGHVFQLMQKQGFQDEEMKLFCQMVLSFCTAEKAVECRLAAVQVLKLTTEFLNTNVHIECAWYLWTSLVFLLQDDDSCVRTGVVSVVSQLVSQGKDSVQQWIPPHALERLLDHVVVLWQEKWQLECLLMLVTWALWEDEDEDCGIPEEDGRVFDKGEMNTYAEQVAMTDIILKHLLRYMNSTSLSEDAVLPEVWVQLLSEKTMLKELTSVTLGCIVACMHQQLETVISESPNFNHSSPFLNRNYLKWSVRVYRLWCTCQKFLESGLVPVKYNRTRAMLDMKVAECPYIVHWYKRKL